MDDATLRSLGLLIAALGGAAVGVERERSGHASGPGARFGGVRTFTLLGGLAGASGWLWTAGLAGLAAVLLAGGVGLVVVAYAAASRHDIEGTTEVAALVTLAAGALAGAGQLRLASAIIAITVLLLVEKTRVHAVVERMDDTALRAGIRFAVMAVVILPLLPEGPFGSLGGIRPRELWIFVLFFSGLSFIGFVARMFVGARKGYMIAGLLGGLVSSTSVTLTFSRASRSEDPAVGTPLAYGVVGACTVLFVRVVGATGVLCAPLMVGLLPYAAAPFAAGVLVFLFGLRRPRQQRPEIQGHQNPLQFSAALQMTVLFQVVLFTVDAIQAVWGDVGLIVSGAVLGLADVDALIVSMAKTASASGAAAAPALAVAVGVLSNTLLKFALAVTIGRAPFRRAAAIGLAVIGLALAGSIVVLNRLW